MCLFPFGEQSFETVEPPNLKCRYLVSMLKKLMIASLIIAIISFLVDPFSGL